MAITTALSPDNTMSITIIWRIFAMNSGAILLPTQGLLGRLTKMREAVAYIRRVFDSIPIPQIATVRPRQGSHQLAGL